MGSEEPKNLTLTANPRDISHQVSAEENISLAISYTAEELDACLKSTKTNTAPGPDGFPVAFFKQFWPCLRGLVLQILNGFMLGLVDISRLNFGIMSLLPKVPGV